MKASPSWRVGALVLVSLGVLFGVLVMLGPLTLSSGEPLAIDFGFAGPVKPGAAVRVSGVVVGAVEEVTFLAGQDPQAGPEVMVRVHVRIDPAAWPVMTDRSRFFVTTLGVLGEHYVDVAPETRGKPLSPGAIVRGTDLARADLLLPRAAALLEVMSGVLDDGRDEARHLFTVLSRLLVRVDGLLQDDATQSLAGEFVDVLEDLRVVTGALRRGLGDGASLQTTLGSAQRFLERADRFGKALDQSDVEALVARGRRSLDQMDDVLSKASQSPLLAVKKQEEVLALYEQTFADVDRLAKRADVLLRQVEEGQGGAGKLFHDAQLVEDLRSVLHELRTSPLKLLFPE